MQRTAPIRQQLHDAVADLSPAARTVFDRITAADDDSEPALSDGFDALTPEERTAVRDVADLSTQVADAEAAEEQQHTEVLKRKQRWLWVASVIYSLGCVIAVAAMLVHVYTAPVEPAAADTILTTPEDVTRYEAAYPPPPVPGEAEPISIPTGVFITLVELTGPYTVEISGQLWQRYADGLPKNLAQGVFLPNAVDQPTLTEVYRERQGDEELIGWTFHATLRERFDYGTYPLGHYQIRLRMWHPDFDRNVYLTPDLQAYVSTDPAALPGVDQGLILENLDLQQAFFSFRTHTFNTDFGAPAYQEEEVHPELYYSLAVRKHLASPLIGRGIAPAITLVMLFVIVMVLTKEEERRQTFGVTPGTVIFVGAAFLLAAIIAHTALRDEVKAPGLVYLESLYIVTYVVTVGVILNAVLLVGRPNLKLFRKHDNFWVRLMYWPLILSVLVAVTLLTIYV